MTAPAVLRLAACGDIMLHGRYHDLAAAGQAAATFAPLQGLLADCDLLIGNLETPLTEATRPANDKLCLRGAPVYAEVLAAAGLRVANLANNHIGDFGAVGLADTQAALAAAGISAVGAGTDLASALAPVRLTCNGLRLGVLAACAESTKPGLIATPGQPGIAPLVPDLLLAAIGALRPTVDHVILLLHWGLEYSPLPTPEQVDFAHAAIAAGVSLILGHHSHCLQGIESYRDGLICYSLGNLTDDGVDWQGPTRRYQAPLTETDRESALVRVHLSATACTLTPALPLWLDDQGRPTLAAGERATKILADLAERTDRLRDIDDLTAYWEQEVIARRVAGPLLSWWRDGSLWDKVRRFRPGQLVSAWLLLRTWLTVRLARGESRWLLYSPRNDTRPMPAIRPASSPPGGTAGPAPASTEPPAPPGT